MKFRTFNDIILELITEARITEEIMIAEEFINMKPELLELSEDVQTIRFSENLDCIEKSLLEDDLGDFIERAFNRMVESSELTDSDIELFTSNMHNLEDVEEMFDNKKADYSSRYISSSVDGNIFRYRIKK